MLEQRAVTAAAAAGTMMVAAGAVVQGVVPAVDQVTADQAADRVTDRVTVDQTAARVTADQAVDRVVAPLMLQPDRLIVAVIMELLEVEWPAVVQVMVMVSV
jgi:hypothetical protein